MIHNNILGIWQKVSQKLILSFNQKKNLVSIGKCEIEEHCRLHAYIIQKRLGSVYHSLLKKHYLIYPNIAHCEENSTYS